MNRTVWLVLAGVVLVIVGASDVAIPRASPPDAEVRVELGRGQRQFVRRRLYLLDARRHADLRHFRRNRNRFRKLDHEQNGLPTRLRGRQPQRPLDQLRSGLVRRLRHFALLWADQPDVVLRRWCAGCGGDGHLCARQFQRVRAVPRGPQLPELHVTEPNVNDSSDLSPWIDWSGRTPFTVVSL